MVSCDLAKVGIPFPKVVIFIVLNTKLFVYSNPSILFQIKKSINESR